MSGIVPKKKRVIIVGAGMGGLTAAIQLARRGFEVCVVEARDQAGGLASGFRAEEFVFDAGPYILLDRLGLEWAFKNLGLELEERIHLKRIDEVYEVASRSDAPLKFFADLETTAAGFDHLWPGSGKRYTQFVTSMTRIHAALQPMLFQSHLSVFRLFRQGAWGHIPFLMRTLKSVLGHAGLPKPLVNAIGIWTHIAGQPMAEAPGPMAFVPALIHSVGAYYPIGGIGAVALALESAARALGVEFRLQTKVTRIRCEAAAATGVETERNFLAADAVLSDFNGVGTYLELVKDIPPALKNQLLGLPLQSPGVCAYLAVKGILAPPYLHFYLPGGQALCRLLIGPALMDPSLTREGWHPARLMSPMKYDVAESLGPAGQRDHLEQLIREEWWRSGIREVRILYKRIPADWGCQFHLYRDSMNPVMTARFMRAGRLAHRSPVIRNLYLAGSATHPGQWVSFCAISGILAAETLCEDLRPC